MVTTPTIPNSPYHRPNAPPDPSKEELDAMRGPSSHVEYDKLLDHLSNKHGWHAALGMSWVRQCALCGCPYCIDKLARPGIDTATRGQATFRGRLEYLLYAYPKVGIQVGVVASQWWDK